MAKNYYNHFTYWIGFMSKIKHAKLYNWRKRSYVVYFYYMRLIYFSYIWYNFCLQVRNNSLQITQWAKVIYKILWHNLATKSDFVSASSIHLQLKLKQYQDESKRCHNDVMWLQCWNKVITEHNVLTFYFRQIEDSIVTFDFTVSTEKFETHIELIFH